MKSTAAHSPEPHRVLAISKHSTAQWKKSEEQDQGGGEQSNSLGRGCALAVSTKNLPQPSSPFQRALSTRPLTNNSTTTSTPSYVCMPGQTTPSFTTKHAHWLPRLTVIHSPRAKTVRILPSSPVISFSLSCALSLSHRSTKKHTHKCQRRSDCFTTYLPTPMSQTISRRRSTQWGGRRKNQLLLERSPRTTTTTTTLPTGEVKFRQIEL